MAHIPLGFRLLLLIGLSLALPFPEHEGDTEYDSYNEDGVEISAHPGLNEDEPGQEEEDPDFQEYFRSVNELMAKAPSEPNEESGMNLARWTPESGVNPDEVGGYLEGDIVSPKKSASRTGLTEKSSRWPAGTIPYEIDSNFTSADRYKILGALEQFSNQTCVHFVPRNKERNYIFIANTFTGCWSYVGRLGGMQKVNLQSPGCLAEKGNIIHELLHVAGFIHENNREDRDKYITVIPANIEKGRTFQFHKVTPGTTTAFGVPYAYDSIMHYSAYAFSKNGQPTIAVKNQSNVTIGQRIGFSQGDITKLNIMYGCAA